MRVVWYSVLKFAHFFVLWYTENNLFQVHIKIHILNLCTSNKLRSWIVEVRFYKPGNLCLQKKLNWKKDGIQCMMRREENHDHFCLSLFLRYVSFSVMFVWCCWFCGVLTVIEASLLCLLLLQYQVSSCLHDIFSSSHLALPSHHNKSVWGVTSTLLDLYITFRLTRDSAHHQRFPRHETRTSYM